MATTERQREPTPAEQVKALYEEQESATAKAFETLVARDSFGELLARVTENIVGLTKIGTDAFDLMLRNLRLAGRQDVTRLMRQLARTEDKLELVLQEVERLGDLLDASSESANGRAPRAAEGRSGRSPDSGGGSRRGEGE